MPESGVLQSCIISIRFSSFMRKFGFSQGKMTGFKPSSQAVW